MVKGALAIVVSAVVSLLLAAAAGATNPARAIVVFGGDPATELTAIKQLKCKVVGGGDKFVAKGRSPEGWRLGIKANAFDGFGEEYPVDYGLRTTNFQLFPTRASSPFYSNLFFPGETPPPIPPGDLALSGNGRKLGFGFPAAFSSTDRQEDVVAIVGNARCDYPRRR